MVPLWSADYQSGLSPAGRYFDRSERVRGILSSNRAINRAERTTSCNFDQVFSEIFSYIRNGLGLDWSGLVQHLDQARTMCIHSFGLD